MNEQDRAVYAFILRNERGVDISLGHMAYTLSMAQNHVVRSIGRLSGMGLLRYTQMKVGSRITPFSPLDIIYRFEWDVAEEKTKGDRLATWDELTGPNSSLPAVKRDSDIARQFVTGFMAYLQKFTAGAQTPTQTATGCVCELCGTPLAAAQAKILKIETRFGAFGDRRVCVSCAEFVRESSFEALRGRLYARGMNELTAALHYCQGLLQEKGSDTEAIKAVIKEVDSLIEWLDSAPLLFRCEEPVSREVK